MEEFRRLAFKGVSDELEDPADNKECRRNFPEAAHKDRYRREQERKDDQGNADSVAEAIHRILMAGGVLRDPVIPRASEEHVASHAESG